jgi:hypothetical protein
VNGKRNENSKNYITPQTILGKNKDNPGEAGPSGSGLLAGDLLQVRFLEVLLNSCGVFPELGSMCVQRTIDIGFSLQALDGAQHGPDII